MKFCDERIQRHLLNGGTLKSIYYPIAPTPMSGYKCILFCTKSKIEVIAQALYMINMELDW